MQTYVGFLFLVKDSELTQKIYQNSRSFHSGIMEPWRQNYLKQYFIEKCNFLTLIPQYSLFCIRNKYIV